MHKFSKIGFIFVLVGIAIITALVSSVVMLKEEQETEEPDWLQVPVVEVSTEQKSEITAEEILVQDQSWVAQLEIANEISQLIIVEADGTYATVSMHTKDENGIWKEDFSTTGRIGKNGIGKEKEGDGKTPTGVFSFYKAFGINSDPGITALPYLQIDKTHRWVDDSNSVYYNQLVSTEDVEPDWDSSEHLYKSTYSYKYVLALDYNKECEPGLGSAIFLHCPSKGFKYTSGCIAIPEEDMIRVMQLLREDCRVIIDIKEQLEQY